MRTPDSDRMGGPVFGVPPRPRDLSPEERRAWDRLARDLRASRLSSAADGAALEVAARTQARVWALERRLQKLGPTYTRRGHGGSEMIRPRPECAMLRQEKQMLLSCLRVLGLTPRSRRSRPLGTPASASRDARLRARGEFYK